MKICLLINIPVPYRIPVFDIISSKLGNDFSVIYFAKKEPNRKWKLENLKHNHIFLKENISEKDDGFNYVHNNFEVFTHLRRINPDCIITTGFNPTHLYAWFYSKLFFKKHIPMTDGWLYSEKDLSRLHKLIRKIVYKTSNSFIGASKNSITLFESYGVKREKTFQSHLCIDNDRFKNFNKFNERKYHIMFSGQFTDRKIPFFFCDILEELSKRINNLKVLILGSGPLEKEFFKKLDNIKLDYHYPGFISQEELPKYYSNSKLFLFTTKLDAWGVVVNEAMASGTPIISTPYAGVINDLVLDSNNGYILDIDVDKWADKIEIILSDEKLWNKLSSNGVERVQEFNFENAAKGILDASKYSLGNF